MTIGKGALQLTEIDKASWVEMLGAFLLAALFFVRSFPCGGVFFCEKLSLQYSCFGSHCESALLINCSSSISSGSAQIKKGSAGIFYEEISGRREGTWILAGTFYSVYIFFSITFICFFLNFSNWFSNWNVPGPNHENLNFERNSKIDSKSTRLFFKILLIQRQIFWYFFVEI